MGNSQTQEKKEPGFFEKVSMAYQQVVNAIIRPPRCSYEISQLGPSTFRFGKLVYERKDFILMNERGLRFHCSHWEPVDSQRPSHQMPCVVYMHGNSSARLECLGQLSLVLSIGATMLALDFSGSGKSDGEYVSLGFFERDDLQIVVSHLRDSGRVSGIGLWGRSMGAATALLYGSRDPSISGMILDSSFADLQMLAEELIETGRQQGLYAPDMAVSMGIYMIRNSVLSAAQFDIRELSPIAHAPHCLIPALFVAGKGDKFIPPSHSEKLHQVYGGGGGLVIVDGDHNSVRPKTLFDQAAVFLRAVFRLVSSESTLDTSLYHGRLPWSSPIGAPCPTPASPSSSSSSSPSPSTSLMFSGPLSQPHSQSSPSLNPALYPALQNRPPSSSLSSSSTSPTTSSSISSSSTSQSSHSTSIEPPPPPQQQQQDSIQQTGDQLDFGMTQNRQQEIRSHLFSMLGDSTTVKKTNSSAKQIP